MVSFNSRTTHDFNPRSPHGERPSARIASRGRYLDFKSTLPARGATDVQALLRAFFVHFNPRSPHGERLCCLCRWKMNPVISIHAPRTGTRRKSYSAFNAYQRISIHAPRTGSDGLGVTGFSLARNFNPRSPHGERLVVTDAETGEMLVIQSTLPARGATTSAQPSHHCPFDFNPRSPHGERLGSIGITPERLKQFQSTLPARGATTGSSSTSMRRRLFQSTLPARERQCSV